MGDKHPFLQPLTWAEKKEVHWKGTGGDKRALPPLSTEGIGKDGGIMKLIILITVHTIHAHEIPLLIWKDRYGKPFGIGLKQ